MLHSKQTTAAATGRHDGAFPPVPQPIDQASEALPCDDDDSDLRNDLVVGADAVAEFLGMTRRQVYGAVERRTLPLFKIGSQICVRRSVLISWIEDRERQAMTGID
nr:helix-turn-helix domain-containing protein [uncultured Devosia sp.]